MGSRDLERPLPAHLGPSVRPTEPTAFDRWFQAAYVCAYRLMRVYWRVRHPMTHGALVALWSEGEVLLIQNSYVTHYSFPGGYVRKGETAKTAAVRELREEVGVVARAEHLDRVLDETHDWEGKRDHVQIFALDLLTRPRIAIDHREVIRARWCSPAEALSLKLFPPARSVLSARMARSLEGRSG